MTGRAAPATLSRAQVGIGTLVVFIAMVLVASVGAGVLLDAGGLLQSTAERTGEEATGAVSDRLQVLAATGTVVNESCPRSGRVVLTGSDVSDDPCFRVQFDEAVEVRGIVGDETLLFNGKSIGDLSNLDTIRFHRVYDPDAQDQISIKNDQTGQSVYVDETEPITVEASQDVFIRLETQPNNEYSISVGQDEQYHGTVRYARPDEAVDRLTLTVRRSPGSAPIDLRNATVQYLSETTVTRLRYGDDGANSSRFTVTPIAGDDALLEDGEQAQIAVDAWYLEGDVETALETGDTVTLTVITGSGTVTRVEVQIPHSSGRESVPLAG